MTREQAKEEAKRYTESYLRGKGLNTRRPFKCINPQHADSHPSMSYDTRRNKCHCFSCGADYDIFDLIGIEYGIVDDKEKFDKTYQVLNISITDNKPAAPNQKQEFQKQPKTEQKTEQKKTDYTDYFLKAHEQVKNTEYLHSRGLSDEIIERFKLGYDEHFNKGTGGADWKAVIIPTTKYTYTARNTAADAEKKDRYRKVGSSVIFNAGALNHENPVFIVEGELDAISIIEAGGNALALGSTANYHQFVSLLKDRDIKAPLVLIVLDNDDDGRKTADNIMIDLHEYQKTKVVNMPDFYAEYKDANEMLCKDRERLESAIKSAENILEEERERKAEEYKKNNVAAQIDNFINGINSVEKAPYIPTGFSLLDTFLEGGLYEGLYVVGAISSLGKTTFCMQIADQIAEAGHDVLIFSLEMARTQLMSKSISRYTIIDCMENNTDTSLAKTSKGISTGDRYKTYSNDEKALIERCIERYKGIGKNIYITEGVGDVGIEEIKEAVKNHIEITGRKPVVFIDYLQIIAPYDMRATDKQNTDKAVLELKRLSRDYHIPIIGISSLNRQSYNSEIGMDAFKESGAIEYSSDVLLGMQLKGIGCSNFDINEAKKKNPRYVEIIILKNRDGITGETVDFEYYAMFNYYRESKPFNK